MLTHYDVKVKEPKYRPNTTSFTNLKQGKKSLIFTTSKPGCHEFSSYAHGFSDFSELLQDCYRIS